MSTSDRSPLDEVDDIYTDPSHIAKSTEMLVGFLEKLVVLAAATIAASVTAIGIAHQHPAGDGGIGYLASAWKALFFCIATALFGQSAAINFRSSTERLMISMRIVSLLNRAAAQGLSTSAYNEQSVAITTGYADLRKDISKRRNLANVLSSVSVILLLFGFYELYRFALVNFHV